jgi:alanyl-tRNA synthetase
MDGVPRVQKSEVKCLTASEVRQTFINFFANKHGHQIVPSSSVIPPEEDDSLLFTIAGMVQFKPIFLGQVDSSHPFAELRRAVNSQKCIRAGGKQNDLDDVGKDVYHHTFFEMLGNWSFGDYSKGDAISWAWELLTEVWKIPADRLYVTYYGGDEQRPEVLPDLESRDIWRRYFPETHETHVLPFGAKDNFWEMGDTGPCGPCSEIHFDHIGNRDASKLVNGDSPEVVELWNLVFMHFNRQDTGKLATMPTMCVDTGLGFERIISVLQGVSSNYDTDLFQKIFQVIQHITGARPYSGRLGDEDEDKVDTSYRIIADHIRMLTVSLADGVSPSSKGRGSVVRRILRRAALYGQERLGMKRCFLHELVSSVVQTLGDQFPNLQPSSDFVMRIIQEEEQLFCRTLERGRREFKKRHQKNGGRLSGSDAHILESSFGLSFDLTLIMAENPHVTVDIDAYQREVREHRERSRRQPGGG